MLKKLLVAIDGTEYSWRALEYAIGIAKMAESELVVLTVAREGLQHTPQLPLEGELAEGQTDGIATPLVPRRGHSAYSPVRPLGMARLISVDVVAATVAEGYPEIESAFSLADPLLPENSGTYTFRGDGTVYFSKRGKAPKVTVEELTQALMGYHPSALPEALRCFPTGIPYMHTMLNK